MKFIASSKQLSWQRISHLNCTSTSMCLKKNYLCQEVCFRLTECYPSQELFSQEDPIIQRLLLQQNSEALKSRDDFLPGTTLLPKMKRCFLLLSHKGLPNTIRHQLQP